MPDRKSAPSLHGLPGRRKTGYPTRMHRFGNALGVSVIVGAVLTALALVMLWVQDPAPSPATPAVSSGAPPEPIGPLLATASAARGEIAAKPCLSCHTFDRGGPHRVGPNLYGAVGAAKAARTGFAYSNALRKAAGRWTPQEMNAFLANPRAAIPGTVMVFAGVASAAQRADIIAYLNGLSDAPKPLDSPP